MIIRNKQLRLVNLRVRGSQGEVVLIPLTPGVNDVTDKYRPVVTKDLFCQRLIENDLLSIDPEIKGKPKPKPTESRESVDKL